MATRLECITRVTITLIIAITVISSPVLMLVNPTQVSAVTINNNSNSIDSGGYHSTPSIPAAVATSPISSPTPMVPAATTQGNNGDSTAQAALSLTRATQTNNIVEGKAYYDISFRTSTAGVIKFIRMSFPVDTYLGAAVLVEATGIGPGTISAGAGGNTLAYTVTNAVNVPANTNIRIQIANANNPPTPSSSLTVSITTRDSSNAIIDGPTSTTAYNMEQVGNAQIAPGAVTTTKIATGAVTSGDIADGAIISTKPAESFMKRVTVHDDAAGHAVGWDPNGVFGIFTISEPAAGFVDDTFVTAYVRSLASPKDCQVTSAGGNAFQLTCEVAPTNGDELHYVVENLPAHVIS